MPRRCLFASSSSYRSWCARGQRTKGVSALYHSARLLSSNRREGGRYARQDRGDAQHYQQYIEAMDAVSMEKVASASAFFQPRPGATIVDVGMASGTSTALLARLFPTAHVIGIDINPKMVALAESQYPPRLYPNVSFRVDDGESLTSLEALGGRIDGFFNCSSLHHVTSYGGYHAERALRALRRQSALLAESGVVVVRDFVKPEERLVELELSDAAPQGGPTESGGGAGRPSDAELLVRFSAEARSLAPAGERGFPLSELPSPRPGWRRFRLFYTDATEFIRRKDYWSDWAVELREEYGYLTQRQFEEAFTSLGLRVLLSAPLHNRWIVRHRYRGRFRLTAAEGEGAGAADLGYPPTNYLVAAEKVGEGRGRRLTPVRHLPPARHAPYLQLHTYRHRGTGAVYAVARRPTDVTDILPYYWRGGVLHVMAKHGYPRPLLSVRDGQRAPLDGKTYSGYVTEAFACAVSGDVSLAAELAARCGVPSACCEAGTEQNLYQGYFPSPGGLAERVASRAVRLRGAHGLDGRGRAMAVGVSGFAETGRVRGYDARQLLLTAQTGALVEARLELNVYRLFRLLGLDLPPWLGERLALRPEPTPPPTQHVEALLERSAVARRDPFELVPTPSCTKATAGHIHWHGDAEGYLRANRTTFAEVGGTFNSACTLEYVCPRHASENTLLTLPLWLADTGGLYVGLEVRELPVPQLFSRLGGPDRGPDCALLTLPAVRLPRTVTTLTELERYLSESYRLEGRRVTRFATLGEKFFPSIGVTTEQVYPYVVAVSAEAASDSAEPPLAWVPVEELFANMHRLEDAHLLIALSRLQHLLADAKTPTAA